MQLLLFCLIGVVLAQVSAFAPPQCEEVNTYHDTCRTNFRYRSHHDWIPYANASSENGIKWRVILDQYDYQTLVGEFSFPQGVWKDVDVDKDGRSWTQGSGGTCTYQLRVSTFRNPDSNNWVFTQAISYCDAMELIVNASVRFSGCTQRPDCENDFVYLHRFDTDNPNDADRLNPENYAYFDGSEEGSRLQQVGETSETEIVKRFLRPSASYTYFAFQDIGTTGQVQRFMVYYKVCQNNDLGLARYPEVPLPPSGSNGRTMRLAQCAEHAHNITSLETYAYEDGCEQDVKCECDAGYQESDDSTSCVACQAGYYKTVQNATCVPCPANSYSDKEAAVICDCDEGYFRADYEGAGVQCTAPPSEIPNELRVVSACDTSVVLEWDKPVDVGRSDYDYDISRNNPDNPDETIQIELGYVDHGEVVTYRVTGLSPSTSYTFSVCVHNGVSQHDSANDKLRIVSQQGTTKQGSIFVLNGVTLPSNSVVLREDIGEGENALSCQAALCGNNIPVPELFYPQNSPVPVGADSGNSMYSTSDPGVAYLSRIDSDMSPLGKYSCQITDTEAGTTQTIFVKIATIVNADPSIMCPQTTPTTSPAAPSTTPATPTTSTATSSTSAATPSTSAATPSSSQATPTTTQAAPEPPTTTPIDMTTTPTPSGVGLTFELNGTQYASGSTISIDDIGEGNSALLCRTDRTDCCSGANRYGEFIYPNNVAVGILSAGEAMYRNRGIQMIRLNRNRNSPLSPQTGLYRCVIPDSNGVSQSISINIVATLPPDSGLLTCSQLINPTNGLVTISNIPIVPGSTATYSCDDGHRLVGSSVRECSNEGTWTEEEPTCEVITCPTLQNPANGRVTQFGNTQGSVAIYLCDSGYELAAGASATRECGESGSWSGETPVCEVRCPPLDHPERGLVTIDGNRNEGSVATYTCDGGLLVLGPTTRTCQSDGTWSNEAPTCGNIRFELNGQIYPNGSSLPLSSIGEGDGALWCVTNNDACCSGANRAGEFYYPDGSAVSIQAETQDGLYRNRGFRIVRLNRRDGATPPTGIYKCEIPDASGQPQNIFIDLN